MLSIKETANLCQNILNEIQKHIIGKNNTLRHVMLAFLADGHILFEDYPGLAKTMICRSFATALGCEFKRIQFTPDLLPQDITGSEIYNQKINDFEFKSGPLFADIILADEINRATPKTQSALLEAMGEYQITVGSTTYRLTEKDKPFIVIATQNPLELEGTFALPEASIDRFLAKIRIGYPTKESERKILVNRVMRKKKTFDVSTVIDRKIFWNMQQSIESVHVSDEINEYIVAIVHSTRELPQVKVGSSPRGSLDLMALARANAVLDGRDYVIPEDVKELATITLAHRMVLEIGSWRSGLTAESLVEKILSQVKAPRKE
ncbi:MAG: AAA family ATPase [Candidatus Hodarchaeales archaeon]|jgi:MoxR-like ATPase